MMTAETLCRIGICLQHKAFGLSNGLTDGRGGIGRSLNHSSEKCCSVTSKDVVLRHQVTAMIIGCFNHRHCIHVFLNVCMYNISYYPHVCICTMVYIYIYIYI